MKIISFLVTVLLLVNNIVDAKVVYVEPVQNAKYVSINNNIIIGYDESIEISDLNSIISVRGTVSGNHTGNIILTENKKKLIFIPNRQFAFDELVEVKVKSLKAPSAANSLIYTFRTQNINPTGVYENSIFTETGKSSDYNLYGNSDYLDLPVLL